MCYQLRLPRKVGAVRDVGITTGGVGTVFSIEEARAEVLKSLARPQILDYLTDPDQIDALTGELANAN